MPTIAHALLAYLEQHPGHDLSARKMVLVGGAAIPETTIRAFDTRHTVTVVHAWGMTETAPLGSICRVPCELAARMPEFVSLSGRPKFYMATDNLRAATNRGVLPEDLIDIVTDNALHYSHRTESGLLFHLIGALSE